MTVQRVAIPSRKREQAIQEQSLRTLALGGVPSQIIDIFVDDEAARESYVAALDPALYGSVIVIPDDTPGPTGVCRAWNAISRHYPVGSLLLCMDDDIEGVLQRVDSKTLAPVRDLLALAEAGFKYMRRAGANVWGVYPTANAMFMSKTVTADLRFLVGCFYGMANHGGEWDLVCDAKLDYEQTLRFWKRDRHVCRLNFIAPKTKYYAGSGGMADQRSVESALVSAERLMSLFPDNVKINNARVNEYPEVRLVTA